MNHFNNIESLRRTIINSATFYSILLTLGLNGCFAVSNNAGEQENIPFKYYLGVATPSNYQTIVNKVLLDNNYHIENYENNATSSHIITRWNIREPYPAETDAGFFDSKTRIFITAIIDNSTFSKNNGFGYDCYMEVLNHVYSGRDREYVEFYNVPLLKSEMDHIAQTLSANFTNDK